jgi:excisionase family DNA binding protein
MTTERLLTVDEVAEFLSVSKMTVYRMIRRGEIVHRKIGGQFRIDPTILVGIRSGKELKSKLGNSGLVLKSEDVWITRFIPVFTQFMIQQLEDFKPDWVIINHRKAARFFEVANLIPDQYAERVLYWTAFRWLSDERLEQELHGKRILIADESVQRARQLKKLRSIFERYGAEVRTVALASRKSCITDGTLQDPKVISCMTLDDYEFSYMAANILSTTLMGTLPFDTDHLGFIFDFHGTNLCDEDIEELAASIGEIHFLPSPVNRKELTCLTVELHDSFDWDKLKLPPDVRKEGACKIRVFYDRETKKLHVIPVIFPTIELNADNVLRLMGIMGEPWSPYMAIPNDFPKFPLELQCELLHRLFVNYCSVKLGLIIMSNMMKLLPDGCIKPENITVEYEDWMKVYGPELGQEIKKVLESDTEQGIRKLFLLPREKREWYDWRVHDSDESAMLAYLVDKDMDDAVETTCQKMIAALRERFRSNEVRGMAFSEFQEVLKDTDLHFISRALDILLDAGLIKPDFEVRKAEDRTCVGLRTYSLSEFGSWFEGPRAFTTEDIAERKLTKILPYSLQRLSSTGLRPKDGMVQKIFANLQHDWDYMRFKPLFLGWVPYIYGPMVLVPKKRAPFGGFCGLRQYAEERNLIDPKLIRSDIWKPSHPIEEDEIFEEMEPEELDFLEGLLDIYRAIYVSGDDETSNILRTLAACRNRRLTYICSFEELRIWRENIKLLIDRVEREISELPSILNGKPENQTIEPTLENIANAHAQLKDKIERYRNLGATKEKIQSMLASHPRKSLAHALLEKIEVPIDLSDKLPYPIGRLIVYESVVGCFSSLLRQGFSGLGLASDTRREKIDYYSGKDKDASFYAERLTELCPEIDEVKGDLDEFVSHVKSKKRTPLIGASLRHVFSQILTILDRDIPPPPPQQKDNIFRIDPESFRKRVLEAASSLKGPEHLLCIVVDAQGFVPWSEKLAEQLRVSSDVLREALQKIVHKATTDIVAKMEPVHFVPLGGDGSLITFGNYDQGISFACQLQTKLSQEFVRFVKIGMDVGDPRADYGAPYGRAFITAYYLTEKIGLSPGQIGITQEVKSRLDETLQKRCSFYSEQTLRTRKDPVSVFLLGWEPNNDR